jgi:hypothetical protein
MFTQPEKRLINLSYFSLIRSNDNFIEVRSKNTGHYWIIKKSIYQFKYPISLYHKHRTNDVYYHLHKRFFSVKASLDEIYEHDDYVLGHRLRK